MKRKARALLASVILTAGVGGMTASPTLAEGTFVDDDGNPHEDMIEFIASLDITRGCTADGRMYCPGSSVTRAQMATFIMKALEADGVPLAQDPPNRFTDDEGSPHEKSIDTLAAMGVVTGGADGLYHPLAPVTRGQMALFIDRGFELPPASGDYFTDVPEVYRDAANSMSEEGITRGCNPEGTLYCPSAQVRRDQMASFIGRALLRSSSEPPPEEPPSESPPDSDELPPGPDGPPPDEADGASAASYQAADGAYRDGHETQVWSCQRVAGGVQVTFKTAQLFSDGWSYIAYGLWGAPGFGTAQYGWGGWNSWNGNYWHAASGDGNPWHWNYGRGEWTTDVSLFAPRDHHSSFGHTWWIYTLVRWPDGHTQQYWRQACEV